MTTVIPGHCIMLDGHDLTRDQALAAARAELEARGWDELDIDDALAVRGVVRRAWWGSYTDPITKQPTEGFVQAHHDGAAVTVVNVAVTS